MAVLIAAIASATVPLLLPVELEELRLRRYQAINPDNGATPVCQGVGSDITMKKLGKGRIRITYNEVMNYSDPGYAMPVRRTIIVKRIGGGWKWISGDEPRCAYFSI